MAQPVIEMRKTCELVRLKQKIRSLVVEILTLRCLSAIEIEMSIRQLYIQVWSSGQRSKKVFIRELKVVCLTISLRK